MKTHFILSEVARQLKQKPYKITYLIAIGVVKEPKLRICNKRMFTAQDIEQIRQVFTDRKMQEANG